ncbi:MAG: hypothetical protein AAFR61_04085 [Bacteroidota bacterium]
MPEIKNYAIRFYGGPKGSDEGIRARVHLFDDQNKMVGGVDFYDSGFEMPVDIAEPQIRMSMPAGQIYAVVDILRNEKPIFLEWQAGLNQGYLGTSQEPVGEGE